MMVPSRGRGSSYRKHAGAFLRLKLARLKHKALRMQQLLLEAYTIRCIYARWFYTAVLLSFTDPSSTRTRFEGVTSHKTQATHLVRGRFRLAAAGGVECLCSSEEGAVCGNENERGGNRVSGKRDCHFS